MGLGFGPLFPRQVRIWEELFLREFSLDSLPKNKPLCRPELLREREIQKNVVLGSSGKGSQHAQEIRSGPEK